MSDATATGPLPNPLQDLHERCGADLQAYGDTPIVSTFGQPEAEYATAHKSAGLMDLPQRGLIEVTGPDRLAFLNNLLSNQTWNPKSRDGLKAGQGVYAFFLTPQGRIVADLRVLELGDRTLLELDGRCVSRVLAELDHYRFAEKVKLRSRVGELHQIALYGPRAFEAVARLTGDTGPAEPAPLSSISVMIDGVPTVIHRDDLAGGIGLHLIVPVDAAARLWTLILDVLGGGPPSPSADAGPVDVSAMRQRIVRPIGWAAFNSARIEAGRPLFGIDFDETVLPAETGLLDRAVSFTKGCYVGQEIVARMRSRGQLARLIAGFRMDEDALPVAGTHVLDAEGNAVGLVTSSTLSPILSGAAIGLALLKRPYFEPGTALRIPAEDAPRSAHVVELPFAKP